MPQQPQQILGFDLSNPQQAALYQYNVSQVLNLLISQLATPSYLAGVIGSGLATNGSAFSGSAAQTVNCANLAVVMVIWQGATGTTPHLTFSNLTVGVPVYVKAQFITAGHFFMSATTPSGTAYAINAKGGAIVDMVGTGASTSSGGTLVFAGCSALNNSALPELDLLYN